MGEADLKLVARTLTWLCEGDGRSLVPDGTAFRLDGGPDAPKRRISAEIVDRMLVSDLLDRDVRDGRVRLTANSRTRGFVARSAGAGFRTQHGAETPLANGKPARRDDTALAWLRVRKGPDGAALISAVQYEAGARLARDFEGAQLRPSVTSNWENTPAKGRRGAPEGLEASELVIETRRRLERAFEDLGPDLADIALEVCCKNRGLEDAEKALHWPKRSAKLVLRLALDRLAEHYGLIGREWRSVARGWAASDARPDMFCETLSA